jgi:hypothetical protein
MKQHLVTLLVLLSGTIASAELGSLPALSSDELQQRLKLFDYSAKWSATATNRRIEGKSISVQEIDLHYTDTLNHRERTLGIEIYKSAKSNPTNTILIFPPLRGLSPFDKGFAKYFAKQGYLAVISKVSKDIGDYDAIAPIMREFIDIAVDNRVLLDYLVDTYKIDTNHIDVLGVSLGGIRAGIFHGVEPRVKATTLVVGGANLPGIMAYSDEDHVVALRERVMQAEGIANAEDYEIYLRKLLIWDPFYSTQLRNKTGLQMIVGERDTKVPSRFQHELLEGYQCPHRSYNKNHVQTAAMVFMNKRLVSKFYEQQH